VVVATINGAGIRKETREFNSFTSSLTEMKEWLLANDKITVLKLKRLLQMLAAQQSFSAICSELHMSHRTLSSNKSFKSKKLISDSGLEDLFSITNVFLTSFAGELKRGCLL
jgi:hypothetical protein